MPASFIRTQALRQAAAQPFYNTSKFTLRDLKARSKEQQLRADFEAYLDGFSPNVQDILEKFEFRNQIPRLSKADALGTLIEKLLSPDINLAAISLTLRLGVGGGRAIGFYWRSLPLRSAPSRGAPVPEEPAKNVTVRPLAIGVPFFARNPVTTSASPG
jgi:hypothetical protein